MRICGPLAAPWWRVLLLSWLWTFALAKDEPTISASKIEGYPRNINYFEDSDSVIWHNIDTGNIFWSKDAGVQWARVGDVDEGKAVLLIIHPHEAKTAFILTAHQEHYMTQDRGETWSKFDSKAPPSRFQPEVLTFNAADPKRIIFNGMDCDEIFCDEVAIYTTDGFKTVDKLREDTAGCWWAKSSLEFSTGDNDLDKSRILCIIRDELSPRRQEQRLVISDDFFKKEKGEIQEFEPDLDITKPVRGVNNIAIIKGYLLVATSSAGSDEMALYVTDDTKKWHRAIFPSSDSHEHSHAINQGAYTVLESTNYSIQVDVMTSAPSRPMGVLFTSNSNGTYFTENMPYTNRDRKGHVDFENVSGIQGVYLVNTVENGADVDKHGKTKVLVSKITFDDGRTFESLKAGEDTIHLHSVTELDNIGRVFSSPAPGLVMGNGNTGKSLKRPSESNLYVSDDAGRTWKQALEGQHKYEFGDSGSILVAVKDSDKPDIDKFSFSLDHGEKWNTVSFPDDLKIRPEFLTSVQDATSLKFLLVGSHKGEYHSIAIDFEGLHERKCGDDDMEEWHARVDADGKPQCIMGHKQSFTRRKKTADCFIKSEFKEPIAKTEDCECSDADFECDFNFQRDSEDHTKCKQVGSLVIPEGSCKGDEKSFKGSSGWRLIPGNTCKRKDGEQKDDAIERECKDGGKDNDKDDGKDDGKDGKDGGDDTDPSSGGVSHKKNDFDTDLNDFQKFYLERGEASSSKDETVIVRAAEQGSGGQLKVDDRLWRSPDHGKKWERILEGERIQNIFPHEYFNDVVYFTTVEDSKVFYTIDRGQSFHPFTAPSEPFEDGPFSFHPDKKDWILWVGKTCEKVGSKEFCYLKASISTDRGDDWRTLRKYVEKCEFTGNSEYNIRAEKQIVCLAHREENEDSPLTIITSDDFFDEDVIMLDNEVSNFITMSEYIILAEKDQKTGGVKPLVSVDGKHFENAHFPYKFQEGHESEYTALDSSTHALNLFVKTDDGADHQYGSIIKSNSNGTSFVLSASNVNCDDTPYVDFEKVAGLEGFELINVVTNPGKEEKTKKIQTKISRNDGAEWGYLAPPSKDVDGKSYSCSSSKGDKSCALHLHHYTERDDKRKTFAAATAVGLMFGIGNVGSILGDIKEADTFMTADGGITWRNVKKGHWTWQYGDQGSIIVLVERATHDNKASTNIVSYSTDEGKTWTDYKFTDDKVTVLDITTLSSGTSRNFLLWCRSESGKVFTVNLDFTGLTDKVCKLGSLGKEGGDTDYDLWSPKHPLLNDDCVFGHVAKYLRKKPDRNCYNGQDIQRLYKKENCACSRRDYECAYNFEMDNSGQCVLVKGLEPLSGKEWCEKNNATTYFEPTGYRRLQLTTCEGGKEYDKTSTEHDCAGYEGEVARKRKASGVGIFFAVVIPVAAALAFGWYVHRNWSGKFGQIRLGESSAATFDSDQPWIKYPVIAISAVVALAAALPVLAASVWRTVFGAYQRAGGGGAGGGRSWNRRFTTRQSFARGGEYSRVEDYDGELLGEDSDEDV
ncbi:hypothetical protein BB8028_0002g11510 [Beauveria bassiana]|uniref:Vacuolar protein sorting/targeting protein 10 n=1 Tax=Beauveria bassiana TaxID=176275 RepID=A0A2S7Y4N3_BEABA|nr:hypothetical protein BB8028_0002g11510 [Beauveria bassiana]